MSNLQMRRFIDAALTLCEAVNLAEADPIDFSAFKAKRAADKARGEMPDSLRYASAKAKQGSAPPASVSDYLRDIVLRNLDAAFGHGTWNAEDYDKLTGYLQAMNWVKMSQVYAILHDYLQKRAKDTGVRYSMLYPNPREAYLHDDPELGKYRLQKSGNGIETETETFPSRPAMYMHVIQMIDPEQADLTDEQKTTLGSFTAEYEAHLARQKEADPAQYAHFPGGKPKDTWADAEDVFDPDAVPTYAGTPEAHYMIPAVEKFLKQFENKNDDEQAAYLWVDHGFGGDPIQINFVSQHEPRRTRTFPDMRALERWVMTHKAGIQRWYDLHANEASRVTDRLLPKITRSMLGLIQMVLHARETGQELSEERIAELADKIRDASWYIDNEKIKDLFQSLVFDIKRPNLRALYTPYHLEWLPERIRELAASG